MHRSASYAFIVSKLCWASYPGHVKRILSRTWTLITTPSSDVVQSYLVATPSLFSGLSMICPDIYVLRPMNTRLREEISMTFPHPDPGGEIVLMNTGPYSARRNQQYRQTLINILTFWRSIIFCESKNSDSIVNTIARTGGEGSKILALSV